MSSLGSSSCVLVSQGLVPHALEEDANECHEIKLEMYRS